MSATGTGVFNESSTGVLSGGLYSQSSTGTSTLSGANTYTGATTLTGGTLILDHSATGAPATNIINNTANSSALTLGGGNLTIKGNSGATNSDRFNGTTFNTLTSSKIVFTQNGAASLSATLGGLTRNAQSTVDVTLPTTGTLASTTTTSTGTNKINGNGVAYSTANGGTTWLTNNAGTLGALPQASYQVDLFAASGDTDIQSNDAPAAFTSNTLRFNTASTTLTINSSGTSTITDGGILVTPTGTGSVIASGGTGAALTTGATGKEFVIQNYADLTINVPLVDQTSATALTIAGTGTTILGAANTFTGQTAVLGGTLRLANQLALQNSTLQLNSGTSLVFDQSVTGNAFTLGGLASGNNLALLNNASTPAAVALTVGGNNSSTAYSGILSGAGGSLTKNGTGTFQLFGANTYTGATVVNGGILYLGNGATIKGSSSVTVTGTGLLGINQGSESGQFGAGVVLTGTGGVINEINNANTTITLDRANTYTGQTTWGVRGIITAGVASTFDGSGNQTSGAFGVNSAYQFCRPAGHLEFERPQQPGGIAERNVGDGGGVQLRGATITIGGDGTNATTAAPISNNFLPGTDSNGTGVSGQAPGGNVVKIGGGTQTFSSTTNLNSYEGTTTIKGGVLSTPVLGTSGFVAPATSTFNGTTTVTVSSTAGLVVGMNIFEVRATGAGTTITAINPANNTITLSGTVGFSGTQNIVPYGFGSGIGISGPAAANLVLDGGTLQYTGAATSTDRLFTVGSTEAGGATGTLAASGTGALNFTNTGAIAYGTAGTAGTADQTRTLGLTGTNTGANTLAPSIGNNGTGAVSLSKTGAGSWTLTGNNTYTGTTTVGGGVLTATGTGSNKALGGTTSVLVNNGGMLLFGAANQASTSAAITLGTTAAQTPASTTGILSFAAGASQGTAETLTNGTAAGGPTTAGLGTLTLNNTATLAFGGASTTLVFGTFTPNGNVLTITGYTNTGTLTAGNSGAGTDDRLIFSGDQSGNFADFNFGAGAGVGIGEVALDGGFYEVTAVPEPSTWAGIVCLGMMGIRLLVGRRKSRRDAQASA